MRRVVGSDDERALSELYDRYGGLVYAAGVRYLGDRTLAEDLVQDVFFSVWRNAASFDPSKAGFSTWIYRIARNRAIDLARRRQRRVRIMTPRMSEEALSKHDEGGDAEEILRTFDVVGALSEISPVQREVLVLAYFSRTLTTRDLTPHGHASRHGQESNHRSFTRHPQTDARSQSFGQFPQRHLKGPVV